MDFNNLEFKRCSSFLPRDSERSVSHFRTPSHAGIDPGTERDLLSIGQNCPQPGKGSLCLRPAREEDASAEGCFMAWHPKKGHKRLLTAWWRAGTKQMPSGTAGAREGVKG